MKRLILDLHFLLNKEKYCQSKKPLQTMKWGGESSKELKEVLKHSFKPSKRYVL